MRSRHIESHVIDCLRTEKRRSKFLGNRVRTWTFLDQPIKLVTSSQTSESLTQRQVYLRAFQHLSTDYTRLVVIITMTFFPLALCLLLFTLLASGVPSTPMPKVVAESGDIARFLWGQIQDGGLHRELPLMYADSQHAWNSVLSTEGFDLVYSYYGSRRKYRRKDPATQAALQARNRFIDFVEGRTSNPMSLEGDSDPHKRISEQIVERYARKQKEQQNYVALVSGVRRRIWGKELGLGGSSGKRRPDHG